MWLAFLVKRQKHNYTAVLIVWPSHDPRQVDPLSRLMKKIPGIFSV